LETEVVLPHASAEVVHPHKMERFALTEVIDPQEEEEISINIVKPTKVIYENRSISLRIDISQTKKPSTQVQKPFATTLEFAQK
jgi:hypothetical protein